MQHGKAKSEHELRVLKSLQNLKIPDWYKNSPYSKGDHKLGILVIRGHHQNTQDGLT